MPVIERDGPTGAYASNGEPYRAFGIGKVVAEDETIDEVKALLKDRFAFVLNGFLTKERATIIEWRRHPEFEVEELPSGGTSVVMTSRLAIVERSQEGDHS